MTRAERWLVVGGWWLVVGGWWLVGGGRWAVGGGRWAVGGGTSACATVPNVERRRPTRLTAEPSGGRVQRMRTEARCEAKSPAGLGARR
ncbi:hypothetical protein BOC46_32565 [Burkholderia pseudomallei]|nr:hypothetical protein BOC46_32565 [Burkholderia pseudomallei]